ncbi:unnamed protein product [Lymnaea stagnalis]|uniref:Protein kinase domain-containing protein n=1 Tax=Lymnaea stagnalis TaxID=6523 RepID=A0AAV2ID84_LYMST
MDNKYREHYDDVDIGTVKGQNSHIACASGEDGPSAMVIGTSTGPYRGSKWHIRNPNSFAEESSDSDYDGFVVNRSDNKTTRLDQKSTTAVVPKETLPFSDAKINFTNKTFDDKDEGTVIDKKSLRKKKVFLPEEEICNIKVPPKQGFKRHFEDQSFAMHDLESLGVMDINKVDNKAQVHELLVNINLKTQTEPRCLNLNNELFSGMENLKISEDARTMSGSFGEVLKVYDLKTKHHLMKKKVKDKVEPNEVEVPIQFPQEMNLARVVGFSFDGESSYIIQEDAGTSLRQLITDAHFCLSLKQPETTEKIMLDVFTGLSVLERHGITHCDIKPENICMKINSDGSSTTKIIDFGSSKSQKDRMTYSGLTPEYLPPAVNKFLFDVKLYQEKKLPTCPPTPRLCEKDDVWAAGMVTLFLEKKVHPTIQFFTGCSEYPKLNQDKMMTMRYSTMKQIADMQEPLDSYFTTGKPILDKMLEGVLSVDSGMRWSALKTARFLKEKLNPEPQLKRQRSNVLWEPKLFQRDNSCEDVDIKKCKGFSQPHIPLPRSTSDDGNPVQRFGATFKLKNGQTPGFSPMCNNEPALSLQVKAPAPAGPPPTHDAEMSEYDQLVRSFVVEEHQKRVEPNFREMSLASPGFQFKARFAPGPQFKTEDSFGPGLKLMRSPGFDPIPPNQTSCAAGVQGFSGKVFKWPESSKSEALFAVAPSSQSTGNGNIPDMGVLFDEMGVDDKLKIRGRRRSRKE